MKQRPGARGRRTAGILLLTASLLCCFSGLSSLRPGVRETYPASGRGGSFSRPSRPMGYVAVNLADAEELCKLPGIGEHMASLILAERELHGPFYYPEDLLSVRGIGPARLSKIRPLLDMAVQ